MRRRALAGAALFCAVMGLLLFFRLVPLAPGAVRVTGPDLGLCLTLAWVLRRPDQVPAPVIALVFLVQDVLLFAPPGLWAAVVLAGTEAARLREGRWRDQPFMVEWLRVAMLIGVMMLGYRIVQVVFMMPVPALGQVMLQAIATIAAYPLTVGAARVLIGLRRIAPTEADQMGYGR